MKKVITVVLAITAVAGLILSGAEAERFGQQIIINTMGMLGFGLSLLGIARVNRGAGK